MLGAKWNAIRITAINFLLAKHASKMKTFSQEIVLASGKIHNKSVYDERTNLFCTASFVRRSICVGPVPWEQFINSVLILRSP